MVRLTLLQRAFIDAIGQLQAGITIIAIAERIGHNFIFQQENARPHTSQLCTNYLLAEGISVLPWPACSPDLHWIEQLPHKLKSAVYKRVDGISTLQGLQ